MSEDAKKARIVRGMPCPFAERKFCVQPITNI